MGTNFCNFYRISEIHLHEYAALLFNALLNAIWIISDLDCSSLDEHHLTAPLVDDADDFSSLMSDCPDDQHDYMLNREVHRIGVFADQAVSKNPLMEVGQAEK